VKIGKLERSISTWRLNSNGPESTERKLLYPPADWRSFIDRLLLWCGTLLIAVGVIFFFAFNWQEMGRFAKFGLAEVPIVVSVAVCWKLGLDRLSGKAALLAATILIGALLALVGQTYQTGADPWQLFAVWALMVLPWVVIGRFGALLLFWVSLVNVALFLYFQTFPPLFRSGRATVQHRNLALVPFSV
jgi:uncharacterized membrane protein